VSREQQHKDTRVYPKPHEGVHPEREGKHSRCNFDARLAGLSRAADFQSTSGRPLLSHRSLPPVLVLTESTCSDGVSIDRLLIPRAMRNRSGTHSACTRRIMRALPHANFTFAKKISHTADSPISAPYGACSRRCWF